MSALTVTLGADTSALRRGMAAATQLVAASTRIAERQRCARCKPEPSGESITGALQGLLMPD